MKVTMSHTEAIELCNGLENNLRKYPGGKIAYAAAKNFRILKAIRDDVKKAGEPRESHTEYREAMQQALEDIGTVDQSGRVEILEEDREKYSDALKRTKKKYSKVVDEILAQGREVQALLAEKIEIDLHALPESLVAENESLDGELMRHLIPFLEE
jgi:hypothetical protein